MMQGDDDSTATIDLAIAFFCSVLVLFVFVAFNLEDAPEDPVRTTLGQRDATVTIEPPTWSAINAKSPWSAWGAANGTYGWGTQDKADKH